MQKCASHTGSHKFRDIFHAWSDRVIKFCIFRSGFLATFSIKKCSKNVFCKVRKPRWNYPPVLIQALSFVLWKAKIRTSVWDVWSCSSSLWMLIHGWHGCGPIFPICVDRLNQRFSKTPSLTRHKQYCAVKIDKQRAIFFEQTPPIKSFVLQNMAKRE